MENSNKSRRRSDIQFEIIEKLKSNPIVSTVLKQVGISRATFYRWMQANKHFERLVEGARGLSVSQINDLCEAQLINLVKEKNIGSIRYWLDNHHPDYIKTRDRSFPGLPRTVLTSIEAESFMIDEDREEILEKLKDADDEFFEEVEAEAKRNGL